MKFRIPKVRRIPAGTPAALLAVIAVAAWMFAAPSAGAAQADVPDASPAERLVFLKPHLEGLRPPRALQYTYVRETDKEPRFTDRMSLRLAPGAGGACCAVQGSFLSGPQAMTLPPIPDAKANPMLLYYLEYEVRQLQTATKGQSSHFRRRIRQAFVDAATVTPVTVRWNGKDLPAQEVRITPYKDDPYRTRFEREATKEYAFVMCEGVPGGVYQIHTLIPASADASVPVMRETLTLDEPTSTSTAKR